MPDSFKAALPYPIKFSTSENDYEDQDKYPHLKFEELPDPYSQPEKIIQKSQVSILYLKGYESLPSSTIVSILLESLFNHRSAGNRTIPPFFTVLEEAQNFIPSKKVNFIA